MKHAEPEVNDYPVLPDERHNVGDRAYRHDVDIALAHVFDRVKIIFAAVDEIELQRAYYLENDADARQFLERIPAVGALRIDDSVGFGKFGSALVVIGNDDLHSDRLCVSYLVDGGDARVDGDDEIRAVLLYRIESCRVEPVSLAVARRYVIIDVAAVLAQIHIKHGDRCNAVDVVVAVYRYLFFVFERAFDDRDRLVDVLHQKRIVEEHVGLLHERARRFGVAVSAVDEQPRAKPVDFEV